MKALQRKESAAITVYLSLILLMLLSLICTIIEGARINTARTFAERALSTATDSVLADYYGPLWKEYHLFGYHMEEGDITRQAGQIEDALSEYMSYTLTPGKNLTPAKTDRPLDLLGIKQDTVKVGEQTRLMDYEGELFINEAVSYMKYDTAADGLEALLDKLSLLDTPKRVSVIYEEKLKAEEKLADIDRSILKLMELLDGLRTSKKGILLDQRGELLTREYFVKKLINGEVTNASVGIHQEAVYQAVKKHYNNPSEHISSAMQKLRELEEVTQHLKEIGEAIQSNSVELANAQRQLHAISSGGKLTKEEKKQAGALRQEIEDVRDAGSSLQSEQEALIRQKQDLQDHVQSICSMLEHEVKEIIPLIREAITVTETILTNTAFASPLVEGFEKKLTEEGENLSQDILQELSESLNQMKQYTDSAKANTSYAAIRDILDGNLRLLLQVKPILGQCLSKLQSGSYSSCRQLLSSSQELLRGYRVSELTLDYSTLITKKVKTEDPTKAIGEAIQNGLSDLVIDPGIVSNNKLSEEPLPSLEVAQAESYTDVGAVVVDFIHKYISGGETLGMQGLFQSFTNSEDVFAVLGKGLNQASEYILLQEYFRQHFLTYSADREEIKSRKPASLTYEQEYLLFGNPTDRDNLSSMTGRLIFLRMIMNFVTLLSDPIYGEEALAAATAMVGFTGLPILISITKTVLLMAWAFSEALVDVCALLQGREVPVLKKTMVLTFPELFLLKREYLQSKTLMIEKSKLSISYEGYLRAFLLLKDKVKLAYHSMDLIQENINLRYEDEFYFKNCFFGFEAKAEFSVGTKFIAIPMIRNYMKHTISGYHFFFQTTNSY